MDEGLYTLPWTLAAMQNMYIILINESRNAADNKNTEYCPDSKISFYEAEYSGTNHFLDVCIFPIQFQMKPKGAFQYKDQLKIMSQTNDNITGPSIIRNEKG